jgi:hypothetical protein
MRRAREARHAPSRVAAAGGRRSKDHAAAPINARPAGSTAHGQGVFEAGADVDGTDVEGGAEDARADSATGASTAEAAGGAASASPPGPPAACASAAGQDEQQLQAHSRLLCYGGNYRARVP